MTRISAAFFVFILCQNCFSVPKIFFTYGSYYDRLCSKGFNFLQIGSEKSASKYLKQSWVDEAKLQTKSFQTAWEKQGYPLIYELVQQFKLDFSRTEYSAILSTCELGSTMTEPLIFNIKHFLNSYEKNGKPRKIDEFIDLPFHELLHAWLNEHFKYDESSILKKYEKLEHRARLHIHLFAIQSFLYEKTGHSDFWEIIYKNYVEKDAINKKALDIINKEGRDKILQEIKLLSK